MLSVGLKMLHPAIPKEIINAEAHKNLDLRTFFMTLFPIFLKDNIILTKRHL
jgi:hypothetical protein